MKRPSGGVGKSEKQKRTKSYHCAKDRVGGSSQFNIQPNMQGILVMCTRARENRAVKEAIDLFNQYADQLYPNTNDAPQDDSDEPEDLEASIAKELAELKDTKKDKMERFTSISTATDCSKLESNETGPGIEPSKFVHDLLVDMAAKQIKKTRYLSRFLPVQQTCMANLPEMQRVAKLVIHPQFNEPNEDGTFGVVPRLRNCTKLDRMEVIKTFAASVGEGHEVNLEDPDLVILVDVTRTVCSMSVVKDFGKLRKYNLESLLGLNDNTESKSQAKPATAAAPTETTVPDVSSEDADATSTVA
ncbi:hypothetical protein [Absidia glauca]|uniref:THUMP domain-containing protein n=1 Tax=Absidia glauca TaxID=4829 RepID=A0A168P5H6_ABSGL|nr:hypothetical protein [Absidia glauca]